MLRAALLTQKWQLFSPIRITGSLAVHSSVNPMVPLAQLGFVNQVPNKIKPALHSQMQT